MKNSKQTAQALAAPWWQKYLPYLLPALAFFLYANSIGNGYNMDDELVTRKHKLASKGISAIPDIFTSPYYSDDMGYSYEYRPVVLTSFAIEHQLFGDKPGVSHFFNVLLYALTVVVLFRLLQRLFDGYSYWLSVLVTLLFVLHPLHTEVVASIKNRDEILALLFGLLAWSASLRYNQGGKIWHLLLAVVWLTVAMLSKVSIAPLGVLVPLGLVFFQPTTPRRILALGYALLVPVYFLAPMYRPLAFLPLFLLLGLLPYAVRQMPTFMNGGWKKALAAFRPAVPAPVSDTGEEGHPLRRYALGFSVRELAQPLFLLLFGLFMLGVWATLYTDSLWMPVFAFAAFVACFNWANLLQRNVSLLAYACFFGYVFMGHDYPIVTEVSIYFFLYLLFFRKGFQTAWVVLGLVLLTVSYAFSELPLPLLIGTAVMAAVRFHRQYAWARYLRYVFMFLTAASFVGEVVSYFMGGMNGISLITDSVSLLIFGVLFVPGARRYFVWFVFSVLLVLLVALVFLGGKTISLPATYIHPTQTTATAADTAMVAPSAVLSPNLIYTAERPISFAEVPVTAASPMEERLGLASDVLGFYLLKVAVPYPMGYYYGYAYFKPVSIFAPGPLVYLLLHLGLLVLAIILYGKHRFLGFGILFYLGAILLFSGFLYPVVGVAGDRFTYLATLGWSMALAYLAIRFLQGTDALRQAVKPKTGFTVFLLVLAGAYSLLVLIRNSEWKNAITLMGSDIDHLDESAQAHNLYALNLMRESYEGKGYTPQQQFNMRTLALSEFERALEIWPDFFNAAYDKGRVGTLVGNFPKAIEGYEAAIRIGPAPGFMEPYYQLTELYLKTQRYPEYLVNARRIFNLDRQTHPEAYNLMAKGHYLNGHTDSAKAYLRAGMQVYPADQSLRKNMAEIFKNQGNADSAQYYSMPR